MFLSLRAGLWTLRNRVREGPWTFLFRLLLGLMFLAGMILFVLWVSGKIYGVLTTLQRVSPTFALSLTERMLYALLLPLFPLMVISSAISTLGGLYNDPSTLFFHLHPITQARHLSFGAPKIFLISSGYVILISIPILLQWGGVHLLIQGIVPLLLYLLTACALGMTLTLLLAFLFPARLLSRMLGIGLAVAGGLFVLSFRTLKPELFFTSPGEVTTLLKSIPSPSPTPPGWTSTLMARGIFGQPSGTPLWGLIAVTAMTIAVMVILYSTLYTSTWQQAGEILTRKRGIKPRIPASSLFGAIFSREALSLLRNPTRFAQLALMAALLILYLYNLTLIPSNDDPLFLHLILTIHVALTGFILGALGVRFAFPAPSLDGEAAWFPAVHPVSRLMRETIRALHYAFWYLILSVIITIAIKIILPVKIGELARTLSILIPLSILLGMTAVGMGNIHPRYDIKNPLHIGFSPEGILYFTLSLLLTAGAAWIFWQW